MVSNSIKDKIRFISSEIGLTSAVRAPKDIKLIFLSRILRSFSYSGVTLLLALYLKEAGLNAKYIGLFMTLGFAGDLVKTALIGARLDYIGRKNAIIFNYIWMALTGVAFYICPSVKYLWFVVFFGCITPGGPEVGIFRAAEYSSIAQLANNVQRSDYYSWYIFFSIFPNSIGNFVNGSLVYYLQTTVGWPASQAYKVVFLNMAICSGIMVVVATKLSLDIESDMFKRKKSTSLNTINDHEIDLLNIPSESDSETPPVKDYNNVENNDHNSKERPYTVFDLYKSSNFSTIIRICLLFFVDVLSKAIVLDSWLAYYVVDKFGTNTRTTGRIFLLCNFISSIMTLMGTVICKRMGPITTMITTHFPCSVFVFLIPFANNLTMMVIFLVGRAMFKNMDIGSKAVLMADVANDNERSALLALQNSFRTMGQIVAPLLTGFLTGLDLQWLSFLLSATIRVGVYEVGIIYVFWKDRHSIGR